MSMISLGRDVEELNQYVPSATKQECIDALKKYTLTQAVSYLKRIHEPTPIIKIHDEEEEKQYEESHILDDVDQKEISEDEKCAMILQVTEQFNDIDEEISKIYLEDFNYDIIKAIKEIGESHRAYKELYMETPLSKLKNLLPFLPDDILQETLEECNNDPNKAYLMLTSPTDSKPVKAPPEQIFSQYALPMTSRKKKPKKVKPHGLLKTNEEIEHDNKVSSLQEIFPDKTKDEIEAVLASTKGNIEDAAAALTSDIDDPIDILQAAFVTPSRSFIIQSLSQAGNNIEYAAAIIQEYLIANPTPQANLIALRPDLTIDDINKALKNNNGDEEEAVNYIIKLPSSGISASRTKVVTYDLHGYTADKAAQRVLCILSHSSSVKTINFITGHGAHSSGGVPILRGLVLHICRQKGHHARILPSNCGVVEVNLQ